MQLRKLTACTVAVVASGSVFAQQPDDELVEVVVVTAQKRAASLQDVPFSISAPTDEQIRSSGATNIAELARNVAGLAIADLGPGQSQVAIRGVSSGQVVRDESSRKETVGVYLDESVISVALFTPDIELFDIQRIEVLRGPQGTLFGSGSLGGTIRYITNQPDATRYEGAIEASLSTIEGGDRGYNLRGAVNVPVVNDRIAVRAVGYYSELAGFIDAVTHDGSVREDVNGGERYGGRLAAELQLTDTITVTPRFVYQRLDTQGFPRADIFNLFCNRYTTTRPACSMGKSQQFRQVGEGLSDDFRLTDATINWDLGPVTLTAVSSYTDRSIEVLRDASQLSGQINAVAIGVPQLATLDSSLLDRTSIHAFSQELRVASNGGGRFQWIAGAYYIEQGKRYSQRDDVPGFESAFNALTGAGIDTVALIAPLTSDRDVIVGSAFDIDVQQRALFGELTYELTDRLTGVVGLRWYDYEEGRNAIISGFYNGGATPVELRNRKTAEDGITPRFIVAYELNDAVTLNAQAAKGFRLGGINDPLIAGICQPDAQALGNADIERFGGEEVWNYEIGLKSHSAGNRLTFNASMYYVDISDLQVSVRLPCSSTVIVNVPAAASRGAEAELNARVTDRLNVAVAAAYTRAEVEQGLALVDIRKGDRLPTTPQWQVSLSASYHWPAGPRLQAFASGNVQYQSESFSFLLDQRNHGSLPVTVHYGRPDADPLSVTFPTELDAYAIANVRFGVSTDSGWEYAVFVNNLANEAANLALDRERGGEGRLAYLRNPPRTVGINMRKSF